MKNTRQKLKTRPLATEETIKRLYTLLPEDIELVEELADKFNSKGARIKNCEIIRAGIKALKQLSEDQWMELLSNLPKCVRHKKKESEQ